MHPLVDSYFTFIRKLIPANKETTGVGIDIGAAEVKMAELTKTGEGYTLLNCAAEPVKGGDLAGAVAAVVAKCTIPPKNVIVSVYGKGTLIRYIDMPRMGLDDLRNSFAIEADKYFPFSQDQIYTDCYILDPTAKAKNMRVMAAAAKREIVDTRLQLLTSLSLQSNFIGLNPVALANVVHLSPPKEGAPKVAAIFDFGDSVSSLTVLVDQVPRFNRDIYIGGRELTKRISNALGLGFEEAEKLKCASTDKKNDILTACESLLANLMQELRLSFDYFSTENNANVEHLYITGGSSKLESLMEMLKENLEIPVEMWDPFAGIQTTLSEEDKEVYKTKLGVALGLALYNYD